MKIITRKEALATGAKRYFTGNLCKYEHIDERYTLNRNCTTCSRLRNHVWVSDNPEKAKLSATKYFIANVEKVRAGWDKYRKTNLKKTRATAAAWHANNREKSREKSRTWRQANPSKRRAGDAKRRAAKLQRTPPWADPEAIRVFYEGCPAGHHVDHTVPLQGKLISGLHVLENLQYLPAAENIAKGNRIDLAAPELL